MVTTTETNVRGIANIWVFDCFACLPFSISRTRTRRMWIYVAERFLSETLKKSTGKTERMGGVAFNTNKMQF